MGASKGANLDVDEADVWEVVEESSPQMSDLMPSEKGDEIRVEVGRERKPLKSRSCCLDEPVPGAAPF